MVVIGPLAGSASFEVKLAGSASFEVKRTASSDELRCCTDSWIDFGLL